VPSEGWIVVFLDDIDTTVFWNIDEILVQEQSSCIPFPMGSSVRSLRFVRFLRFVGFLRLTMLHCDSVGRESVKDPGAEIGR
jgi:hypothetical protein